MTNGSGNAEHANVTMQRRDTGGCDALATKIWVKLGRVGSGDLNELRCRDFALLFAQREGIIKRVKKEETINGVAG